MSVRPVFLILLALVGVGVLVERLIVTDKEAIENLVEDAEDAFNERRFDDLVETLVPDFQYAGRDRDATRAYLQRMAKRFEAAGADVVLGEPQVDGDAATAQATVRMRVLNQLAAIPVSIRFARVDGRWRFKQASPGYGSP